MSNVYNTASNVYSQMENGPTISQDIGLLAKSLKKINLRNNRIGGRLPNSIGSLTLLTSFDLSYNRLQGELPDNLLTDATGLEVFRIGHNLLNGTLPELQLSQLTEINLSFNDFTGDIAKVLVDLPELGKLGLDKCTL